MSDLPEAGALRRKKFKLSLLVAIPALVVTTGGLIVFFTLTNTRRTMEDFGWALFREATNQSINDTRNVIREAIPDIETLANLYRKRLLATDRGQHEFRHARSLSHRPGSGTPDPGTPDPGTPHPGTPTGASTNNADKIRIPIARTNVAAMVNDS